MASEAASRRREARVRRILGNMDDRLKKISGSQFVDNEPITKPKVLCSLKPAVKYSDFQSEEIEPDVIRELLQTPRIPEPKETKSAIHKLAGDHQIHVAVLAVFTYIMLRTHAGFLIYESVMVPFYTLVFGKQVFGNRRSGSNSSLIFSLLSIYTANNKFTSTLLEIFSVVASASRDFCLYLFIIIVASVLFGY